MYENEVFKNLVEEVLKSENTNVLFWVHGFKGKPMFGVMVTNTWARVNNFFVLYYRVDDYVYFVYSIKLIVYVLLSKLV